MGKDVVKLPIKTRGLFFFGGVFFWGSQNVADRFFLFWGGGMIRE